jgi:hypothetical protein
VNVYAGNLLIGSAVATGTTTPVFTDGSTVIPDGEAQIRARQAEPGQGFSVASAQQVITIDTVAPLASAPMFDNATSPHRIRFNFSEVVGASLDPTDLSVTDLLGGPAIAPVASGYGSDPEVGEFIFDGLLPDSRFRATLSGLTDHAGNPLASAAPFDFLFYRGDATGDGSVNISDFSVLAAKFNQPGVFGDGDFNYSGTVEIGDFSILASRFNTSLPAARAAGSLFLNRRLAQIGADFDLVREDVLV